MLAGMEISGRFRWAVALLGAASGIAALTITWLSPRNDLPPIDLPAWLHPPGPTPKDDVKIASSRQPAAAAAQPEPESVVAAMLPPKAVADALQAKKQRVVFSASMLIGAGIAEEISEGMVRAAEDYARGYDAMVMLQLDNMQRCCGDYFMAIWPELGDLIRTGKATTEIRRLPEGRRSAPVYKVGSTFVDNPHRGELIFSFKADQWAVSVKFKEGPELPQPELFARVREALARDNSKDKAPR